jgi:NYN domain
MKTSAKINFHPAERTSSADSKVRKHRLSKCEATGLARYRDRHQARDGANALAAGSNPYDVIAFACPDCRGWHVEKTHVREPIVAGVTSVPTEAFSASLGSRKRRYILFDVENPTCGAKATCEELADFWDILKQQAPGIAPHDHVVIGASRSVVRKYRSAIHGPNIKWVVGANAADAADRALLAAIDLRRVAREYDELVIVSGDWRFADLARRARRAGLSVQVVTAEHPEQRSMLSRELAAAADTRTLVRLEARTPRHDTAIPMDTAESRTHSRVCLRPIAA